MTSVCEPEMTALKSAEETVKFVTTGFSKDGFCDKGGSSLLLHAKISVQNMEKKYRLKYLISIYSVNNILDLNYHSAAEVVNSHPGFCFNKGAFLTSESGIGKR